jgi:hypothetical protein
MRTTKGALVLKAHLMIYEKSVFLIIRNNPSYINPNWRDWRRFVSHIYKLAVTFIDNTT